MPNRETATGLYAHTDPLDALNRSGSLEQKLAAIHEAICMQIETVDRISVAAYEAGSDVLRTFLASAPGHNSLVRYESHLADSPSLLEIVRSGRARLVNDLQLFRQGRHLHTRLIAEDGFRWSYTVPIYHEGAFRGFIFFNSRTPGAVAESALGMLDVYAHLISAIVTAEMLAVRILAAAVRTARDMVHFRDPETGEHTGRMSRYTRLIAQHLAATGIAGFDDSAIERLFAFAPLHDLGKIAIPDSILLKTGDLSNAEREEMQQHTVRGRQMIDAIARNFSLEHLDGLDMLRHIAELHHETLDGAGYPHGLRDGEIPLEVRIVAVADVFDALTSARPYKPAWSNEEAYAWLRKLARCKFDENCVEALVFNAQKVKNIQAEFPDASTVLIPRAD